jgi:6-phosphofructokinase
LDSAGLECRITILGHVQRGGSPSTWDRNLSTIFGIKAAELSMMATNEEPRMLGISANRITVTSLASALAIVPLSFFFLFVTFLRDCSNSKSNCKQRLCNCDEDERKIVSEFMFYYGNSDESGYFTVFSSCNSFHIISLFTICCRR